MELTSTNPSTMAGTRSFAERMDGIEDHEQHQDVGLRGLGAQMSNTQILEQEMMGNESAESKLDEDEDIEIDMMDDDEGTHLEPETIQRGKYAEEGSSPKKSQNDSASLFGTETPKINSFKRAERSQSPRKAPYTDLSESMSSQGSKNAPRRFPPSSEVRKGHI